jgi:hypothetical protein
LPTWKRQRSSVTQVVEADRLVVGNVGRGTILGRMVGSNPE